MPDNLAPLTSEQDRHAYRCAVEKIERFVRLGRDLDGHYRMKKKTTAEEQIRHHYHANLGEIGIRMILGRPWRDAEDGKDGQTDIPGYPNLDVKTRWGERGGNLRIQRGTDLMVIGGAFKEHLTYIQAFVFPVGPITYVEPVGWSHGDDGFREFVPRTGPYAGLPCHKKPFRDLRSIASLRRMLRGA